MKMIKEKKNILILDDHPFVVNAYTNILLSIEGFDLEIKKAHSISKALYFLKSTSIDLVLLDISLPSSEASDIKSGEDMGAFIRSSFPQTKIIVLTALNDNLRLYNIFQNVNPNGFLIKSEIDHTNLIQAFKNVLNDQCYFSNTINEFMVKKVTNKYLLDELDYKLLEEMSNGSNMKDLLSLIPLTRSGIEKRKRNLKIKLCNRITSDRDLIIKAKVEGFI